jgi:hypothetical protein
VPDAVTGATIEVVRVGDAPARAKKARKAKKAKPAAQAGAFQPMST